MADYLIGDVQGCFDALKRLLNKIDFSQDKDRLFFLGDVINRGPQSLQTLRFIQANTDNASMVLGNHDFHLLACALGGKSPNKKDSFIDILDAKDKNSLIDFLLQQPLVIEHQGALLVHAGIPPTWGKKTALEQSQQVQVQLQQEQVSEFLALMYDNYPNQWSDTHNQEQACRYTINACMRMRFCTQDSVLEFGHKGNFDQAPEGYQAWFMHPNRVLRDADIFFGHWSTLRGVDVAHIYPMDHGCIWGGELSAIRLEDKQVFSSQC